MRSDFGIKVDVGWQPQQLVAHARQFVHDCVGFVAIASLDVGALFARRRILRELRDEHAELRLDLREPRAIALAAGGGLALLLFARSKIRFELRLRGAERFALAAGRFELAVERGDAAAQPFDARVHGARLFHQRRDLREHLLARQAAALAIVVEHREPRFCGIAFGSERRRAFAQLRAVRRGLRLHCLRSRDALADAGEFAFEPGAFVRVTPRIGLVALVLALGFSRAGQPRAKIGRRCARGFEIRVRALGLNAERGSLCTQGHQRRFDARLTLARGVARDECGVGARVRRVQPAVGRLEFARFSSMSASRRLAAWKRRERIERSRTKRPPVIAPPPVICSPPSVTIVSRRPRPRTSSMPTSSVVDDQHVAHQEFDDPDELRRRARPVRGHSRSRPGRPATASSIWRPSRFASVSSGRNVARPASCDRETRRTRSASSDVFVTMFERRAPNATSIARA